MTALSTDRDAFLEEIRRIATAVAAVHADEVDRESRFPVEAITALKEAGALSAWVPLELGGGGLTLTDIATACGELARGCSATAMIFAMHQLQVANIVRHLEPDSWFSDYLSRLVREQRLIASITSEVGTGGDMARSIAALSPNSDGTLSFTKQAPTISYGGHCDDYLTSVRRAPDASEADQVMVLHSRADSEVVPTGVWDTLGMRGTCSPGFTVTATISPDQILDEAFRTMMTRTIVPISHIVWTHVWLGIGTEAFSRGRAFLRAAARRAPDQPLPAARKLSDVLVEIQLLRAEVASAIRDFEHWDSDPEDLALSSVAAELRFNTLKAGVSERVPGICQTVMSAVGIMGYKNDSPFSIGRLLRDSLSAQLMVSNERIHGINGKLLGIVKNV